MELNYWIINIVGVFVLSVVLAGVIIPQILLVAFRKELFDEKDERKIHKGVVPRLGGIAFKPVILFSIILVTGMGLLYGEYNMLGEVKNNLSTLAFVYCAIEAVYIVGVADDLIGVRYRAKFILQILCAVMLIAGGLHIDNLHGVFGLYELPSVVGWLLTVLVVCFIVNAVNLIDGIDGLSSGLCGAALIVYGVLFYYFEEYMYATIAFATLGVLVPFFYYNVFGNSDKQKKIFMGDTGSLTLGMVLCVLSFRLTHVVEGSGIGELNPMVLAFVPLIVPCFDVLRVYIHRIRNKKNPFEPDKNHIHHKLLRAGLKQRRVMVCIVLFSLFFTFCNFVLACYLNVNILLAADIIIWTLGNIWLTKYNDRKAHAA